MRITTQLASLALALTTSLATAGGDNWMTDFAAAKKKAADEKKDLLVDFTGSDWCGWCIKLNDEVFKHDAFKKGVADKFVLVELDFPQDKSKLSEATQKQNGELQKKYSVQGFPTILLMDAQGRPFAQTGYQEGGPESYLTHLDELRAKRIARDKSLDAAAKLEGTEKAKALVEALKLLPEAQLGHYQSIMDEITKLDPEDTSGFVKDQQFKAAKKKLEEEIMTAMRGGNAESVPATIDKFIADHKIEGSEKEELLKIKLQVKIRNLIQAGDTDKALALVDSIITDTKATGEKKQELLGMKIGALINSKQFDAADKVLDAIIAEGPETRTGKFAEQFKPRLQQMKEQAAAQEGDADSEPKEKDGE